MRRVAKWIGLGLGILIVAAVTLLLSSILFIESRWGAELARRYVMSAIDKRIAGNLQIGAMSLSLHRIVVRDLAVHDPSGVTVARIPRIAVAFELAPLLHRRLVVDDIRVFAPALRMIMSGSTSNAARALAPRAGSPSSSSSSSIAVDVRNLALRGGRVLIERPNEGTLAFVDGLTVDASATVGAGLRRCSVQATVHGHSLAPPAGGIVAEIRARADGALDFGEAELRIGDSVALFARVLGRNHYAVHVRRLAVTPRLGQIVVPSWPLVVPVELAGHAELRGTRAHLDIRTLSVDSMHIHVVGGAEVRQRTTSGVLLVVRHLDPAELFGRGPAADIDATVRIAPGSFDLADVDARAVVDARAADARARPIRAHLTARLSHGHLRAFTARASARGTRAAFHAEGGPGRLPDEQLTLHGTLIAESLSRFAPSLHGPGGLRISAAGDPAAGLSSLSARVSAVLPRVRLGSHEPLALALSLSLEGAAARRATLDVRDIVLSYGRADGARHRWTQRGLASVELGSAQAEIRHLALTSGRQSIVVSAERSGKDVAAHMRVHHFHLRSVSPIGMPELPTHIDARLDGRATVTARRPRLDLLVELSGSGDSAAVLHSGRLAIRYRPELLSARASLATRGGGALDARAEMPLRVTSTHAPPLAALERQPVRATVSLHSFKTSWVAAVVPSLARVHGIVDGELVVRGTARHPRMQGNVDWRDGAVIGRARPSAQVGRSDRERSQASLSSDSSASQ